MIIATYAVVIDGDIFLNSALVHSAQHKHEKRYDLGSPGIYCKVGMQGRFWYISGMAFRSTNGMSTGLILGGVVGGLIGAAIDGPGPSGPVGVIYDPVLKAFSSIIKCEELRDFSIQHYSGMQYPCIGQKFKPHQVRQFVFKINSGQFDK